MSTNSTNNFEALYAKNRALINELMASNTVLSPAAKKEIRKLLRIVDAMEVKMFQAEEKFKKDFETLSERLYDLQWRLFKLS